MNIRVIAEETLRLVGAGFVALAILAVVWVITPKQDRSWCNVKSMECFDRLAVQK